MKHLFYSTCYPSPHLETELEIALDLIKKGEDVYFLVCNANLNTCFINPAHKQSICSACVSKVEKGLALIDIPEKNKVYFKHVDKTNFDVVEGLKFNSIEDLKSFEYKSIDLGLAAASSLVSNFRNHKLDTLKHERIITHYLKTGIFVYESMLLLVEELKPDFVYLFNGRFIESRPLMRLCEQKNIVFYTHERGADKNRYLLIKNQTPHSLSRIVNDIELTWNNGVENKYEIGEKFYLDRRQGINQSWLSFTQDQKIELLPTGFDMGKRNIAIFNTSMDEYESIPDFKNLIYKDDNDGIRNLVESFLPYPEFHFYLRVHPNLKGLNNFQMTEIKNLRYPNLTVIMPDEPIDSYHLMLISEKTISFGSTVGIEANYFKKPSILLGRAFYENVEGLVKPDSHESAVSAIRSDIEVVNNHGAIKYGYWCSLFGEQYKYYQAESLFKGKFLGKNLKSNLHSRMIMKLNQFYKDKFLKFDTK